MFFGIFLCFKRLYGSLQLEYHVAGLHFPAAADPLWVRAAGAGEKGPVLLCDSGSFYSIQLLYLYHDLYFHGHVCDRAGDLIPAKEDKRPGGNRSALWLYSLLAGGLAAVVLLPEIYALQATASGDFDFPKTISCYFSIFDMIARHIGNVGTEIGLDHWPNIYCGVAVLMFLLLYLGAKKITVREKAVYCGLLLMFYASFSINVLNFIWHGFHYPNSLPCRQSFIYIALVLTMCFRAYLYLDEISKRQFAGVTSGAIVYVILAEKLVTDDAFEPVVWYVAVVLLLLYLGVFYFYQNKEHFAFTRRFWRWRW